MVVNDVAARLFWSLAEIKGVQQAISETLETKGECLFSHKLSNRIMERCEANEVLRATSAGVREKMIAQEALSYLKREENIIGAVHLDELPEGRSQDAISVDTSALKASRAANVASGDVEVIGTLFLRHPLPAIAFARKKPSSALIRLADTKKALGFDAAIFMSVTSFQEVNNIFLLYGVMIIPVPNLRSGGAWDKAIQNSFRFAGSTKFFDRSGSQITIESA